MEHKKTIKSHLVDFWRSSLAWIKHHKKTSIAVAVALIVAVASFATWLHLSQKPVEPPKKPTATVKKTPAPKKHYSPLTGREVADEAATKANVTAIMIENSPDARPQSGLQQADIVYEAIAEGGITRFAAIYQQERPELIGPVRSLRMYYLDWIAPYDASIAHVGGSLYSLQEVRNGTHRDIDQFHNPDSYWRASDRYAPHNVYTSFGHLDALNTSREYATSNPQPLERQEPAGTAGGATSIQVAMSGPTYNSAWNYNAEESRYLRSQAGEAHTDREHGQIAAEVVVVLKMHMDHVMEDGWRENYHTSGTGDAVVFANGTAQEITWHKENMRAQLSFTNKADGGAYKLPPGKTWFSAVPVNEGGAVTWQ